jgi:hypothetical protein
MTHDGARASPCAAREVSQVQLRFPTSSFQELSDRYVADLRPRDRRLTDAITQQVFPSYGQKGYLTKDEFLTVCEWKTPRSKSRCDANDASLIREISSLVRTTKSERLRIQIWTLLAGVKWPTASVFLHFAFADRYPILDFRALWSLSVEVPSQYTFPFWWRYTEFCRELASQTGVTLRVLDQALWQYSKLHQPKRQADMVQRA